MAALRRTEWKGELRARHPTDVKSYHCHFPLIFAGILWWCIAAGYMWMLHHHDEDLLAALSPAEIDQLPHVDTCQTCRQCVVEPHSLSAPSVCAQPENKDENFMMLSTTRWRLSHDYKDERWKFPHCPVCWGCVNELESIDQKIDAFNTTFVHKSGASNAWYFYTKVKCPAKIGAARDSAMKFLDVPRLSSIKQPKSGAVVKMWCLPFDHQLRRDPYEPNMQDIRRSHNSEMINKLLVRPTMRSPDEYCNKTMPYEIVQKEISMMRIARECGIDGILPKVWVGPVKAVMPGTGFPIDMDALWQTRAPGVSLHNIAHWSTRPETVLKALNNGVNSTQVEMAAIFDLLTSQCDRKANNLFLDENGGITLIDNNQALANGHMCNVGRQLNSIFLPSSVEHTFRAVGRIYAKQGIMKRQNPSPHVLMDYRCHIPGGTIGKNYPPKVKQCLTRFKSMDVEGLLAAFGLINFESASLLKHRASAMLEHGFEWTLLNAQPMNSEQYRYSPQPPCCKMHYVQNGTMPGQLECIGGWEANPSLHRPIAAQ